MRERCKKKVFEDFIEYIYKNSEPLSDSELRRMFYKGVSDFKEDYLLCEWRKYKGCIWIFIRDNGINLKTVILASQMWDYSEYNTKPCKICRGTGKIKLK